MESLDRGGPTKGSNVVKFGKAKKRMARNAKEKLAEENRARFGESKSVAERKRTMLEKLQRNLDGHRRETGEE